jgi:hypothetical protein
MDKELKDIDLSENKSDDLASILRGAAGTVPWIGSFVAELITTIIPNGGRCEGDTGECSDYR